MPKGKSCRA